MINKQYTVAICDILGFSRLIRRVPLEDVVEHGLGSLHKALHFAINKVDWPETPPSLNDINKNPHVGMTWFSDTFLLYTREDSDVDMQALLEAVACLIYISIINMTSIRAGVAYGKAVIDPENAVYVGEPIIDAHEMEERQQWAGGALHESAIERIPESIKNRKAPIYPIWPIVRYQVPLKRKKKTDTTDSIDLSMRYAINWTYVKHIPPFKLLYSKNSDEPSLQDWKDNPSICEKWKYTREFHSGVCRDCTPCDDPPRIDKTHHLSSLPDEKI
ncbi:MAG: hypothetical protein WAN11_00420 [Syntrophobacteraceae bacterium]